MYNIGLVVGNLEDDFSSRISRGAMKAAQQTGDNLFIFPVKYLNFSDEIRNNERQQYEYQYNFLMSYAQSKSIDIIILCLGVISYRTPREEYMKVLESFSEVPVLLVASEEAGYPFIMYDNMSGLRNGIQYLIQNRGCKKICMFTGNRDNADAIERLQVYKQVLAENNLVSTEDMIGYGDFSAWCTEEAQALFDRNPDMDAVVCGNDLMARAMYKIIQQKNLQIGKDICVLGFDDMEEAAEMKPPLATISADTVIMGEKAVWEAHALIEECRQKSLNKLPVQRYRIKTEFVNRESASGVYTPQKIDLQEMKKQYQTKFQNMIEANHRLNILTRDMLMYEDSQEGRFSDFLEAFQMDGITECFLFMLDKPIPYYAKQNFQLVDKLYLQAYKKGEEVKEFHSHERIVSLDDLFIKDYFRKKPKCYVIIDIYSREVQYGIMVCDIAHEYFAYVENLCYQISLATKIIDLLQIQEELLKEKEVMVQKLARENLILDNISNKDELTGINNRRGFITNTMEMMSDKKYWGRKAALLYADLNYLKLINDRYSHAEGNYALQACARVLDGITCNEYVAGRIGGDEFALFCILEDAVDGDSVKGQLKQNMETVNRGSHKPYEVSMSIGVYDFVISKESNLKELLTLADERLYVEKKAKKPFVERII